MGTSFSLVYDSFLSRVTDDMYLELNELDTFRVLQSLLINAIPWFEFPRKNLLDYEEGYLDPCKYSGVYTDNEEVDALAWVGGCFNCELTQEEINIISLYMVVEWLGQQLACTDNTKIGYTGSDFKMTSQANHMSKLKSMIDEYEQQGFHMQRLYKRRKINDKGNVVNTMALIMGNPVK